MSELTKEQMRGLYQGLLAYTLEHPIEHQRFTSYEVADMARLCLQALEGLTKEEARCVLCYLPNHSTSSIALDAARAKLERIAGEEEGS